ncbi:hypothetical protein [Alteromonas halophila]|uniref:Uncharacterized protein n=1 Tax=Alteromonas halophila TaxID=516698 RepID=A0A918JPJ1_9ALTE|nr:hypothetical protein [Alteromonas halophila]GGW91463.1 hypothetical protein GCM10007391_27290 [Alteromonas halophila]
MQSQAATKQGFIQVEINEAALLRALKRCDLHASELHCLSREGKHHLQQLLLKAASQPQK